MQRIGLAAITKIQLFKFYSLKNFSENLILEKFCITHHYLGKFLLLHNSLQHNILRSFCLVLVLWTLFRVSFLIVTSSLLLQKKFYLRYSIPLVWVGLISSHSFIDFHRLTFPLQLWRYFVNGEKESWEKRKHHVNSFHNTRTRQKERRILCCRLLLDNKIVCNSQ